MAGQPHDQRLGGAQKVNHALLGGGLAQPRTWRPLSPSRQTFVAQKASPWMILGIATRHGLELIVSADLAAGPLDRFRDPLQVRTGGLLGHRLPVALELL